MIALLESSDVSTMDSGGTANGFVGGEALGEGPETKTGGKGGDPAESGLEVVGGTEDGLGRGKLAGGGVVLKNVMSGKEVSWSLDENISWNT